MQQQIHCRFSFVCSREVSPRTAKKKKVVIHHVRSSSFHVKQIVVIFDSIVREKEIAVFFCCCCVIMCNRHDRADKHENTKLFLMECNHDGRNGDDCKCKKKERRMESIYRNFVHNKYLLDDGIKLSNFELQFAFSLSSLPFSYFYLSFSFANRIELCCRSSLLTSLEEPFTLRNYAQTSNEVSLTNQPEQTSGFQTQKPISFACNLSASESRQLLHLIHNKRRN